MPNQEVIKREEIEFLLSSRDFEAIRSIFEEKDSADIAEVMETFDIASHVQLFRLVKRSQRPDLFSHIEPERQEELLSELPDVVVTAFVNGMEPDDRTKLLEELPYEQRDRILQNMDPEERRVAWRLLSYPEDSVGRLMTTDFVAMYAELTAINALDHLRWQADVPEEHLHNIYVIEKGGHLIGEVSLGSIVLCDPPRRSLREIMNMPTVILNPDEDQNVAVEAFRKYDRSYIPVQDKTGRIIGIVTADDVFDVAEEEATEDIQQFGGHAALEDSYFTTPYLTMIKKRAGWLAILFLGTLLTGSALKYYNDVLVSMPFLIFFLPLIVSSGGNSGTQAASLILRGIAIQEISVKNWFAILWRELLIGFTLGTILGLMGFVRAATWGYAVKVGLVVFLTLELVVILGVVAGSMLPLVFKQIKLDPAVVSSPFITTVIDVTGTVLFINIALLLLKVFV